MAQRIEAEAKIPAETKEFFQGDELRIRVFWDKYALRDLAGNVVEKTPVEMWRRVAREIASVEKPTKREEWEQKFFWLLENFRFVPGGRIMFGAGQPRKATLINCYTVPIKEDSIEGIFEWCKEAARTYSFGGGVGTDLSILRPKNSPVNNAAIYSTGSVSFMDLFSTTTGTIGQSGRRGALMITISVDHPDVVDFIEIKNDPERRKVQFANISVRVTDEFMRAVERDEDFTLRYENEVIGKVERKVKAREIWEKLVKAAWESAEPGVIFWNTMKRESTTEYNGMEIMTTNPCSEIPLEPYGACCLGSVNLSAFVLDEFTKEARIDWDNLEKALRFGVRFLDDVLDYNAEKHPLRYQREASLKSRRIGVGFTGLADCFIKLGLKYDTEEAIAFADELFKRIKNIVYDESTNLAIEKGAFSAFDLKKHLKSPFIKRLDKEIIEKIKERGLRNAALLTVPPVGSGSVLAGTTSGIEPIFSLGYLRRSKSLSKEEFEVRHPLVKEYMARFNLNDVKELPEIFVTAHQISPQERVRMQATIQKHIDHAISSCLTKNNLILTGDGFRYIGELSNNRDEGSFTPLEEIKVVNSKGLAPADSFYYNGIKETLKLTIEGGYQIEGTANHRVLVLDKDTYDLHWKRLDELTEDDWIVMRKGLETWGNQYSFGKIYGKPFTWHKRTNAHDLPIPKKMSKGLARFLGYLLSDGFILKNTVGLSQVKGEVLDDFIELSKKLFGYEPKLQRDERAQNLYTAFIHSRELVGFLKYLGLEHKGSEKRTPLCILSTGREMVKEYIRGLTLDGYVAENGLVPLCNNSPWLIQELQQLLLNFGIESIVTSETYHESDFTHIHGRVYQHEQRSQYKLYLLGENARLFMEYIGFAEERKNEEAWHLLRVSRPMRKKLFGKVPTSGQLYRAITERMERMKSIKSCTLYERAHSFREHVKVCEAVERENLFFLWEALSLNGIPKHVFDPTYAFKRVKSIEPTGAQQTFDLSVPQGQHYIANGIVSHNTVNLPKDITPEEVERIYFQAWKNGCKGITVYREGSREGILITEEEAKKRRGVLAPRPRPKVVKGKTFRMATEMGSVFVTVNEDEQGLFEVFVHLGKSGSSSMAFTEAIGRLISLALRSGVKPSAIIDQLKLIKSSRPIMQEDGEVVFSVPDAIAKAMERYLRGGEQLALMPEVKPTKGISGLEVSRNDHEIDLCPMCGGVLIFSGGCYLCQDCGFTRCD